MQKRFLEYIQQEHLIEKNDRIVVGVSGGADSVCLLRLLHSIQNQYDLDLHVVHVHHGIRGEEADHDANFVKKLAGELNLPFCLARKNIPEIAKQEKLTEEEAGRNVRYGVFRDYSKKIGADKIALAHHQNDQAETVLFQLFRGSGARGIAGMSARRGKIIRPLLFAARTEIEAYLEAEHQPYCMDATNESMEYSRNVIRNKIMPEAEALVNRQAVRHIAGAAQAQAKWRRYIEKQGILAYHRLVEEENQKLRLDVAGFQEEDPVIQDEVIYQIFQQMIPEAKDVEQVHYEMLRRLCGQGAGKSIDLPKNVKAERQYETVVLYKKKSAEPMTFCEECKPGESHMIVKNGIRYRVDFTLRDRSELPEEIPQKDYTKWLDYDMIINGLFLRNPQESDFFIMDAEGRRKKLSRHFIDRKVPKSLRAEQLVLADGNHIAWVFFDRMSERYKVTEGTKRVFVVTVREQ
ncbi:MAG: tRNA lysidine(34) synthetase TilS [Eubacterium sp.]|nr:tRNA lysidine(34) synthetase TilS [Eubacterium sp.]